MTAEPFGAEDAQAGVQAGVGRGGAVDDAERAGGELDHRDGGVLDLDALVRQAAGVGEHLDRGAERGDHQVDGVHGLVHQRAAAVEGPGAAPVAGVVVALARATRRARRWPR